MIDKEAKRRSTRQNLSTYAEKMPENSRIHRPEAAAKATVGLQLISWGDVGQFRKPRKWAHVIHALGRKGTSLIQYLCLRLQHLGFVRLETRAKLQHRIFASQDCFAAIEAAPRSFCRGRHDAFPGTLPTDSMRPDFLFLPCATGGQCIAMTEHRLTDVMPDSFPPGARLPRVQEPLRPQVSGTLPLPKPRPTREPKTRSSGGR
jgi:hypothetical protein